MRIGTLPAGWRAWLTLGDALGTAPGVHAPSAFSALLADALHDVGELTVIDAGCGAGLISIAALSAGARRVLAIDSDLAAVELTERNVRTTLGPTAVARLELVHTDFSSLGQIGGDLLAVNPPQRPTRLLAQVESRQRHLHTGGGQDGLDTLRTILATTRAPTVWSTAARVLAVRRLLSEIAPDGWRADTLTSAGLPGHPAWESLTGRPTVDVDIWSFRKHAS